MTTYSWSFPTVETALGLVCAISWRLTVTIGGRTTSANDRIVFKRPSLPIEDLAPEWAIKQVERAIDVPSLCRRLERSISSTASKSDNKIVIGPPPWGPERTFKSTI